MTDKSNMKPYVVCCEPRVVVMGWATEEEIAKEHPTLVDSRMCVRWTSDTRGVMGLAAGGPTAACRITPAVSRHTIRTRVEAVLECSDEAAAAWEREPWI